jgi:hypothetical protein
MDALGMEQKKLNKDLFSPVNTLENGEGSGGFDIK